MKVQIETDLSIEMPDRCGNNCAQKSRECALVGAVYITRRVFESVDRIKTLDEATIAKKALDEAGIVLSQCESRVHNEGLNPIRSTMDLEGNVTFSKFSGGDFYNQEVLTVVSRPSFVDPADVFGRVS